ncbi:CpaF family protein [Micrococcus sp.]|uniref:CpaF family protein n=1 Tax=Micrococcus sp. TaxID=1271 RepID=UPI002A91E571|nr:ATPase, T2SS/T4P/T4SS family [Micrococcus sp.]MDY6055296.1 ATPase, T2SS/T4P/T4SS family [Micrococcus sp.]
MDRWVPDDPDRPDTPVGRLRLRPRLRRRPPDPPEGPAATRRRLAEALVNAGGAPADVGLALPATDPDLGGRAVALREQLVGFGPLAPWVRTPGVTDVLVTPDGAVWTDGAEGMVRRPTTLGPAQAQALAVRLLTQAGRRLDPAVPLADARVHGIRVHAVLPPVSADGTVLSLRVPSARTPTLNRLAEAWPDGPRWLQACERLVAAHATVLVSGATGSGKTTLLSAALGRADPRERIVLVEDTREADLDHPHVVPLQTRAPNAEGAGEVGLAELIRQALRMRPDRLVVGECRGAEVADLLTALNTGHRGAWGTLHANAADDVPARLSAMGALAGWSPAAVAAQTRAGVDAVVHVRRDGHGRHPVELAVPDRPPDPAAPLRMLPALTWTPSGGTREGPGAGLLAERLGVHG